MLNVNTQVILLNSSLVDYKNQLSFPNLETQINYFASKELFSFDSLLYVDSNRTLKLAVEVDRLNNVNYIMYRNISVSNKWYFGFVTSKRFLSKGSSIIDFELDSFQTYQFDITFMKSFVERKHVTDDSVGNHLMDEGFNVSNYVTVASQNTNLFNGFACVVEFSEWYVETVPSRVTFMNNVVGGLKGLVYIDPQMDIQYISDLIKKFEDKGKLSAITNIYMIPNAFLDTSGLDTIEGGYPLANDLRSREFNCTLSNSIKGYSPRNKKLLTYPFTKLVVVNNQGTEMELNWNYLNSKTFKAFMSRGVGGICTLVPNNYNSINENFNETLSITDFPVCSWVGDSYNNWSSANSTSRIVGGLGSIASLGFGILSANPVAIVGGVLGIGSVIGTEVAQTKIPNNAQGVKTSNGTNVQFGKCDFTFISKSITVEQATMLDDYFTMFGYKVNSLEVPQLKTRSNFNYIKTQDINIKGNIDVNNLRNLQDMFNNGTTIWHDPNTFCNYS